jgi:hypothetical protein
MFLKGEVRRKDGKEHVYCYLAETTRLNRAGGAAAAAQPGRVEHHADRSLAALYRSDRRGRAGLPAPVFQRSGGPSSAARGGCLRIGSLKSGGASADIRRLLARMPVWEELGLDKFWSEALGDRRGAVEWSQVMELLAVNRLCAPGSELSIRERWFSRTANRLPFGVR